MSCNQLASVEGCFDYGDEHDVVIKSGQSLNILIFYRPCIRELVEISSSHGGEYDVQSCLLGYTAV
jgi:hypothetical protein